jgi:rhodanese-related sulfurtransferase
MAIEEINVRKLAELGRDVRLIDVREDFEFEAGHVGHAVNLPMSIVGDHLDEFQPGPVYVICKTGGRSQRVCELAAGQGHTVVNIAGGTVAWMDSGYDTVGGA